MRALPLLILFERCEGPDEGTIAVRREVPEVEEEALGFRETSGG